MTCRKINAPEMSQSLRKAAPSAQAGLHYRGRRAGDRRTADALANRALMATGGCFCRDITWSTDALPSSVHYCHCSICRRWTGSPFATLAWFPLASVRWAGSSPVIFRTSPIAVRTHCARCGTPLCLIYDCQDQLALAVGSFDEPETVTPNHHYGSEGRLRWVDIGKSLPNRDTKERW